MAYEKTVWEGRVVERPRTFNIQENSDGTVTLIPAEGKVYSEGTAFSPENMNKIENEMKQTDLEIKEVENEIKEIKTTKASTTTLGLVKVDGKSIMVNEDGVISGYNPPIYYYNAGVHNIPLTGGWKRMAMSNPSENKLDFEANYFRASLGYDYEDSWMVVSTQKAIDVGAIGKMRFYLNLGCENNAEISIRLNEQLDNQLESGNIVAEITKTQPLNTQWLEIDTSTLSGEYYIQFKIYGKGYSRGSITVMYIEGVR